MDLREYIEEHDSTEEIFDYLFDCNEWYYFINSNNVPLQKDFEDKGESIVVFIDKNKLKDYVKNMDDNNMVVMRPRPALKQIIELIKDFSLVGILVNNFYYLSKSDLKWAYNEYSYIYYKKVLAQLNNIEDSKMRNFQYMRGFFMLPYVYIWGDEEFVNTINNPINTEENETLGFVFDSIKTAKKYKEESEIETLNPKDLIKYDTSQLIYKFFDGIVDSIVINGRLTVPYNDFKKMELMFLTVE